jgi:hypothetical protein
MAELEPEKQMDRVNWCLCIGCAESFCSSSAFLKAYFCVTVIIQGLGFELCPDDGQDNYAPSSCSPLGCHIVSESSAGFATPYCHRGCYSVLPLYFLGFVLL